MTLKNDPSRNSGSDDISSHKFTNEIPILNNDDDSESSEEEEEDQQQLRHQEESLNNNNDYYQLLPQNDSNATDHIIEDDDDDSEEEEEPLPSLSSLLEAAAAAAVADGGGESTLREPSSENANNLFKEAERDRIREETLNRQDVYKESNSPHRASDIKIDEEAIKNAMKSVKLPSIPPWAKEMSNDDWKKILTKTNPQKDDKPN